MHDDVADLKADLVHGEFAISADDFDQEFRRIRDADRIGAVGADAGRAEFGIAQHDRVFSAPFQIVEAGRVDVVDLGLEGRFEAVIPVIDGRQDRHVVGFEHVKAGRKDVRQLAFMHEHGGLTFAYGQLGAVLDLVIFAFETPDHRVACVIHPMNDVDEFSGQKIKNTHG